MSDEAGIRELNDMLTFNAILQHKEIDPGGVRLARHQDTVVQGG
jgi:hypothetical protein